MIKKITFLFCILFVFFSFQSKAASIFGVLQDEQREAIIHATVALYATQDSSLIKVGVSDDIGEFKMQNIGAGNYFLTASYVGFSDLTIDNIALTEDQELDLGALEFQATATELKQATVTAFRDIVEVKADRTVFNVQGTINSTGSDAISLLRVAPGVAVDNENNINVLGRSGVLLFVDGKRLPLTGEDLSNYLQNLPAEQIDKIDIITNPGARYEAEGNAGIIDIRLKKDKSLGANGSVNGTYSKGEYARYNLGLSGNYRNKRMNVFGTVGIGQRNSFFDMFFKNTQNGIYLDKMNESVLNGDFSNFRIGTDFFVSEKHTVGFLVEGRERTRNNDRVNRTNISDANTPSIIDSILVAENTEETKATQNQYNVNYRYDDRAKERSINLDLDFGRFNNESNRLQPNRYFNAAEDKLLAENIVVFDSPTEIDIYTAKLDFEEKVLDGKLGFGTKLSRVVSDNTFLLYNTTNNVQSLNDTRSNLFDYDENVYAGYINYARSINKNWSFSAGLRAEQTDATGDLKPFNSDLAEPPVELNYLSWFPNAGLFWKINKGNSISFNYGRRINRPDYNVLNPFTNQLSELFYEKGNPFLRPEIVNNFEIGYTLKSRYNFKLAYSRTTDQITRLVSPDDIIPRAGFITWDNLADQTIFSFNASLPIQITKWWNAFFNINALHLDNQANYGDNAIVDLQAFSYSAFQQHTFTLPLDFKGEISSYFSGPGIWGSVFEYDPFWSLNLGLQRKFLQNKLNVKLSFNDIFYTTNWNGKSTFNGLISEGSGFNDSRRAAISISYNFGNQNVKSRKRKIGIEAEAKRISEE